jgi:L-ascorbate metabolism protein UlaG (beta-lactamase superfamily)
VPAGRITFVGHATTLIEIDGTSVLTDPLLRARIGHVRRIAPPVATVPEPDAILISHAHRDHLDLPSLRRMPAATPVLAPPAVAAVVAREGRDVTVLEAGESARVGALEVIAVTAHHDGRRVPVGPEQEAIGFVVAGGGVRVYFAGDTDLFAGMCDLAGDLDVALLPVWGWGPKTGPGHLDPERAARAAGLLRPRLAIPVHWGTYASPRVWWRDDPGLPAREFERHAAEHAPGVAVAILAPGDAVPLSPATAAAG